MVSARTIHRPTQPTQTPIAAPLNPNRTAQVGAATGTESDSQSHDQPVAGTDRYPCAKPQNQGTQTASG